MNIYAPPGSDLNFYRKIINMTVTKRIFDLWGDLNIRLSPKLDNSNPRNPEPNS